MAKIKIKIGEMEVEIDSRDFYVDNESVTKVIETIANSIKENSENKAPEKQDSSQLSIMNSLDNAETFEPEFSDPIPIDVPQIRSKILYLSKKSFFTNPRTVSETVEELRERGWQASPLDVSKVLAKMALNGEILRNSQENKSYYFVKEALLAN